MSLRTAVEAAANLLDSLGNATCLGHGTRSTVAKTAEQLRFELDAPDELAEARQLLSEWLREPNSFDDSRIKYVEKQVGRFLIRDTEDFLKRTE